MAGLYPQLSREPTVRPRNYARSVLAAPRRAHPASHRLTHRRMMTARVPACFGRPASATATLPAVLILHGSRGVDGRGASYAKGL